MYYDVMVVDAIVSFLVSICREKPLRINSKTQSEVVVVDGEEEKKVRVREVADGEGGRR